MGTQIGLDFAARQTDPVQVAVDAWLHRHAATIHSWEGTISDERGIADWLPGYMEGVYIVGEYSDLCRQDDCEDCAVTPTGFRTCRPRVKIGIASDMYMRLANLKCGQSRELEVMALMPFNDRREAERELHKIFASQRVDNGRRTEWFWNCAALEDLVCEVVSYGAEYQGR